MKWYECGVNTGCSVQCVTNIARLLDVVWLANVCDIQILF